MIGIPEMSIVCPESVIIYFKEIVQSWTSQFQLETKKTRCLIKGDGMKKAILFICLLITFGVEAHPQSKEVTMNISLLAKKIILGEPLEYLVTIENGASEAIKLAGAGEGVKWSIVIEGPDGNFHREYPWGGIPGGNKDLIPKGKTFFRGQLYGDEIKLFRQNGKYQIWAEYESPGKVYDQLQKSGATPDTYTYIDYWKGQLKSNICGLEVYMPIGDDLRAYNEFHGDPLNLALQNANVKLILLQSYPTSTYAAYALAEKIPDLTNPLFVSMPPSERVKSAREEGKIISAFPQKDFEEYFQLLDKAGKAGNIPDQIKASFYCYYGDLLVKRGRFAEAEKAFQHATEVETPFAGKEKVYYDRAKEFLVALKSEGLSKN
jgi:hypothetical protein